MRWWGIYYKGPSRASKLAGMLGQERHRGRSLVVASRSWFPRIPEGIGRCEGHSGWGCQFWGVSGVSTWSRISRILQRRPPTKAPRFLFPGVRIGPSRIVSFPQSPFYSCHSSARSQSAPIGRATRRRGGYFLLAYKCADSQGRGGPVGESEPITDLWRLAAREAVSRARSLPQDGGC